MPRAVPIVIALLALQAALVLLFVLPSRAPEPHGLPVGVVGPASALPVRGDAFDVHSYAGADAARTAIREREVTPGVGLRSDRATRHASPDTDRRKDRPWR